METSGTLKFQANVPVEVALKYDGGREVTSSFNQQTQKMYTLVDGRRMYLDLSVAARVDELKLKPGEVFTLCRVGRAKDAQWVVSREKVASGQCAVANAPAAPMTPLVERRLREIGGAHQMTTALRAAVTAAADAESYAKSIGFEVRFTPADIAQMACIAARLGAGGAA